MRQLMGPLEDPSLAALVEVSRTMACLASPLDLLPRVFQMVALLVFLLRVPSLGSQVVPLLVGSLDPRVFQLVALLVDLPAGVSLGALGQGSQTLVLLVDSLDLTPQVRRPWVRPDLQRVSLSLAWALPTVQQALPAATLFPVLLPPQKHLLP